MEGSDLSSSPIKLGITRLLENPLRYLGKARVGLVANYNAIDERARPIIRLLHECPDIHLTAIFSSEHGLWGAAQAGVRLRDSVDDSTGVKVFSLYGDSLKPTPDMMKDIDLLLCDGRDIGCRYATGISTMSLCMEAAAEAGKPIVITDRPNPLGGTVVDGNVLQPEFRSFVGCHPIATRYGMTAGELASMFNEEFGIGADLTVIPMEGWERGMLFPETQLFWVGSPNMPGFETALVYPGTCLFEGTTCSEGRGTTKPFRLIGAPWISEFDLADTLNKMEIAGVRFRPVHFIPVFSKYKQEECKGVEVYVTDSKSVDSIRLGIAMLHAIREQNKEMFKWVGSEDSATGKRLFIDLLSGGNDLRTWLEEGLGPDEILSRWRTELEPFEEVRNRYLLY